MEEKIQISIIVPIYNSLDCLEKCVTSICNQTYKKIEILLVDDGSTDGTSKLCDDLGTKDARIRVFHKSNGGSSSARNLGIREAKGAYLGFVDSDDFISEDMYEKLIHAAEAFQVPIVQASRDEIDTDGNVMKDVCIPPEKAFLCSSEEFMKELLLHRGDCSFCTKLVQADLLVGKSFPEGKLNEDFYLLVQLLQEMKVGKKVNQVDGIYILPEQLYHVFYRIGSNTRKASKDEFSRVFMDIVENADFVSEIVDKHYPQLKQVCIRFGLFQKLDYMLHIPIGLMNAENKFYQGVKVSLRKNYGNIVTNQHLSGKNKAYLLLLATAPKLVRRIHSYLLALR